MEIPGDFEVESALNQTQIKTDGLGLIYHDTMTENMKSNVESKLARQEQIHNSQVTTSHLLEMKMDTL